MKTKRSESLAGQIVGVNVLLVVATLFAAGAAASLDLEVTDQRARFGLLAMTILLALLVNMSMLRRRLGPLERLIEHVEAIDPAEPDAFEPPADGARSEEVERLVASVRRLLGRIEEERRRSVRLVLRAQEAERKRIARDLHDEANQALTGVLLRLEALAQVAPDGLAGEIAAVKGLTTAAMEELVALARQLRPAALDDHGLVSAIDGHVRRFADQTGIRAGFEVEGDPAALSEDSQVVLYRVAQEALFNVARHAGASNVDVKLSTGAGRAELRVRDDGSGFDQRGPSSGLGLAGMVERVRLVGGELEIDSAPGRGATVTLRVG